MESWIDEFVKVTAKLDSPVLFRKWTAIATLAAVMEQKVWMISGGDILHPNLYVVLIGHPGTGKTRSIRAGKSYILKVPEFHMAPTSLTSASLVDAMAEAKRMHIRLPDPPLEYNTLMISADELGTFVSKYDDDMIAVLSAFYDPDPYGQDRRGKDLKIRIKKPQLNILCGSTPSNLLKFMPEGAWDQGFTSRIMFIFSDERIVGDDFAHVVRTHSTDLEHDLNIINSQVGAITVTEDYRNLVNLWRAQDEAPQPNHPKLVHYNTRRRVHLYKLSMIASMDRSSAMVLTRDDFNRAMNWMVEAETYMPDIFKAGVQSADSQAMDELYHWLLTIDIAKKGVPEHKLFNEARKYVPAHSVERVLSVMVRANQIEAFAFNAKTKMRMFRVVAQKAVLE